MTLVLICCSVLTRAYPVNPVMADAWLSGEIARAARDPGAKGVFRWEPKPWNCVSSNIQSANFIRHCDANLSKTDHTWFFRDWSAGCLSQPKYSNKYNQIFSIFATRIRRLTTSLTSWVTGRSSICRNPGLSTTWWPISLRAGPLYYRLWIFLRQTSIAFPSLDLHPHKAWKGAACTYECRSPCCCSFCMRVSSLMLLIWIVAVALLMQKLCLPFADWFKLFRSGLVYCLTWSVFNPQLCFHILAHRYGHAL